MVRRPTLFIDTGLKRDWLSRRQQRKLFYHDFQQSAVHQFNSQQLSSARALALKLKNTQDVLADIRQSVLSSFFFQLSVWLISLEIEWLVKS